MVHLTLFEVHLEDSSFTANAPGSGKSGESESSSGESGRRLAPAIVGLVVLVGLGLAARRFMGGSDLEEMDLEESEVEIGA